MNKITYYLDDKTAVELMAALDQVARLRIETATGARFFDGTRHVVTVSALADGVRVEMEGATA